MSKFLEYQDRSELLERILELKTKHGAVRQVISTIPSFVEPNWHEPLELRSLQDAAEAVELEEELIQVKSNFEELEKSLHAVATSPYAHRMMKEILEVVQKRDVERYPLVYEFVWRAKRLSGVLETRDTLLKRLKTASPELASQIISSFADHAWDGRMAKFTEAWNWARADQWLRRLNDPRAQERLSNALDHLRIHLRELIRDLAASKAWKYCFSRLMEPERQSLMAWTKAK